jgi:hypothetical protein
MVKTIYVLSWNDFLNQIKVNEKVARLKLLAKEKHLTKKEDNIAKMRNAKGELDPKCIAYLIQKEVAIQRQANQQKIKSLEAKVCNQNIGKNNTTKNSARD